MDEQVARHDDLVRELMAQFVCVRLIKANSLDLKLFQFDHDLTFAAFFLNADRTIYGRFGTRSTQKADDDVSLEGFAAALQGALELHRGYPANRARLSGKQPVPTPWAIPEEYPSLKGKYQPTLDYEGQVARSCIHCHQVGEAVRLVYREGRRPLPDRVMFPFPMPEVVGLELDTRSRATVVRVEDGSAAARAGFREGDRILALEDQPLVSVADVQWVLHQAPDRGRLNALVQRGASRLDLALELKPGWRRASDVSWRATTWDMRRMATGGLLLQELNAEQRRQAGLEPGSLALRCEHVGQYGEHATAKNAGFRKDDIIVAWDGRRQAMNETDLIAWMLQDKMPGAKVPVSVRRGSQTLDLELELK